jgi:hypothetical protein
MAEQLTHTEPSAAAGGETAAKDGFGLSTATALIIGSIIGAPFFLAAAALALGIPVYDGRRGRRDRLGFSETVVVSFQFTCPP